MRPVSAVVVSVVLGTLVVGGPQTGPAHAAAPPGIVTGPGLPAGAHVRVFDAQARLSAEWMSAGLGARVATGNVDGVGDEEIAVRTGNQYSGASERRRANGELIGGGNQLIAECVGGCPYNEPRDGAVALGDSDDDGRAEEVVGAFRGEASRVSVSGHGADDSAVAFDAYPGFTGGVFVAVGDTDGNGRDEIVTGAGAGGGPHVRVFELGADNVAREEASFFAFDPAFRGGVRVAAANVDTDSADEIVVAAGPGGGPHVRAFDGNGTPTAVSFFAYDPRFTAGVYVAGGDADGDLRDEIVTGAGAGGGPHVRMFERDGTATAVSFFAYDPAMSAGVHVAVLNRAGSGSSQSGSGGSQNAGDDP